MLQSFSADTFRDQLANPKLHAYEVDQRLGFTIDRIEFQLRAKAYELDPEGDVNSWGKLLHEAQSWIGLDPQTLLTPYDELSRMCDLIDTRDNIHFVDLGAAYGRMGFVLKARYPNSSFTGVEIVQERVDEGNRVFALHDCQNARLIQQDMFHESFQLPLGDCYMIYDYGVLDHLRWTMGQLENLADVHRFQVIARGDTIRSLIQYAHPWLTRIGDVKHEENFSVYTPYL
jgi:hypothetical protein